MTPEESSALAVRATCSDLETWATSKATDGYVGLNDLLQTLELLRSTTEGEV